MAKVKNTDTLNFQIDKLSEAIESMMKGFETLQAPKTLDSDIIRVRPPNMMHVGLTGDDDLSDPDSFCKDYEYDPEKIGLYYDQACMIKEDFRSFELEKQENQEKIFEDLQGKNSYLHNQYLSLLYRFSNPFLFLIAMQFV